MVTILFADVAGSTALGEQLDPETVRSLMGRYFAVMKRIIEAHGGTVEKFIGDAVMAVFGIPVVHEDDALRAVRAAIDIRTELAVFDAEVATSRGVSIRFRTGINTGEVVAGDSSTGETMVTGDPVNTAARLQQAAPVGEILLGRLTWQLVRDAVTIEIVEPLSAKGKAGPLPAFRLLSVDAAVAGHVRRLDTPLVGREREMVTVRNAFERVASERSCQLFTLLGMAGVGKSRLVEEFAAGIATEATILRGRCLSYGEGITYRPIGEIVRSAAGIDETDDSETARSRLRTILDHEPDADAVSARVASGIGLSIEVVPREELFWAIRKLLEHLAQERPLVVIIEDIHWAEQTLLDLIEHLTDWSRGAPILILCPARPELLDTRPGWGGELNASNVPLEPLGAEATRRLIAVLPGGGAIPAAIEARVTAAAEGNPLYVEEFLGMLVDDGLLRQAGDGTWTATEALTEVRMPASISALLSARLERLEPDERAVAERASVVGRVFEQAAVTELAGEALRPAVVPSLISLVRKELVRPERSELSRGDAFKFRHILIRDAAYDRLPKAERAELHEQFADWLERVAGDRAAQVDEITGDHLDKARSYRMDLGLDDDRTRALALRAGRLLASAGRRNADRDEVPTAVRFLSRAEELLAGDPAARFETLIALVYVAFEVDYVATMQVAERLLAVAAELDDIARRRARLWVWSVRTFTDPTFRITDVRAEVEEDGLIFAAAGDTNAILDLRTVSNYLDAGRHWGTVAASARIGLELAATAGRETRREDFAMWLCNAEVWGSAHVSASIATLEALFGALSRRKTRATMLESLGLLRGILGDQAGAEAAHLASIAIWDELGHGRSHFHAAFMRYALDDFTTALHLVREEAADLEHRGETGMRSTMVGLEAWILAIIGDDDGAARAADEARRLGAPDDALTQILWRSAKSVALARRGQGEEADQVSAEGVGIADRTDDSFDAGSAWLARAQVLSCLGRIDESAIAALRSRELYTVKGFANGIRRAEVLIGG